MPMCVETRCQMYLFLFGIWHLPSGIYYPRILEDFLADQFRQDLMLGDQATRQPASQPMCDVTFQLASGIYYLAIPQRPPSQPIQPRTNTFPRRDVTLLIGQDRPEPLQHVSFYNVEKEAQ